MAQDQEKSNLESKYKLYISIVGFTNRSSRQSKSSLVQ
jgi:hypothetical protein